MSSPTLRGAVKGLAIDALLAMLFYRSAIMIVVLLPIAWYFAKEDAKGQEDRKKERFRRQFADGMKSFSAGLRAGYAPENAIDYAARECHLLYEEGEPVTVEFDRMAAAVRMNHTPEAAFSELAARSGLSEASLFAEVFGAARKGGGNLIRIVGDTVEILESHIRIQDEIVTALRAKEMEQHIMNLIPMLVLLYMNLASPKYLSWMYGSLPGRVVMTICLVLYAAAYRMSVKILEAEKVG